LSKSVSLQCMYVPEVVTGCQNDDDSFTAAPKDLLKN